MSGPERQTTRPFPEYATRWVSFAGLDEIDEWSVKIYTIDAHGSVRPEQVLARAREGIPAMLPDAVPGGRASSAAVTEGLEGASGAHLHGEAFAIVHAGEDAVWLLVFWWTDRCLLHRRMAGAPLERPHDFTLPVPETLVACSWELAVVRHERDAWVRNVQGRGAHADLTGYRSDVLDEQAV